MDISKLNHYHDNNNKVIVTKNLLFQDLCVIILQSIIISKMKEKVKQISNEHVAVVRKNGNFSSVFCHSCY